MMGLFCRRTDGRRERERGARDLLASEWEKIKWDIVDYNEKVSMGGACLFCLLACLRRRGLLRINPAPDVGRAEEAAHLFIPRTALPPEPLQYLQETTPSCTLTCPSIPRARRILAPEPLQYLQVTMFSCCFACPFTPGAALAPEPLQYLQVTMLSCTFACAFIPRAALAPEPLQYIQVTVMSCMKACAFT